MSPSSNSTNGYRLLNHLGLTHQFEGVFKFSYPKSPEEPTTYVPPGPFHRTDLSRTFEVWGRTYGTGDVKKVDRQGLTQIFKYII